MRPLFVLLLVVGCSGSGYDPGDACEFRYASCREERADCFRAVRREKCPNEFDEGFDFCLQDALTACGQAFDLCIADACLPPDECTVQACPR